MNADKQPLATADKNSVQQTLAENMGNKYIGKMEICQEIQIADIVLSLNGRDAGKRFLVLWTGDGYSILADGKRRKIDKPKKKNNKHIMPEGKTPNSIATKLIWGHQVTNNEIRRVLAQSLYPRSDKGGM